MSEEKNLRVDQINQMLLKMASGNFFYRLKRSVKNDNIEALIITLNMLAEEIQEAMLHQGYVNSNDTFLDIVQMSFVLDENGIVTIVNQQTCTILSTLYADIIGMSFESLLAEESKNKWSKAFHALNQRKLLDTSLDLKFKASNDLVIPKTCYITTSVDGNDKRATLITVIHHTSMQKELENDLKKRVIQFSERQPNGKVPSPKEPKPRLTFDDIRKIRKGHDMIINNLERDLPTLKNFALQLGTNEFKLKYGFKELYGTSVYRFLKRERLRKAKMMIQFSGESIKSIAHMTGFKTVPHFSRTFKERFGFAPSELRKKAFNSKQ